MLGVDTDRLLIPLQTAAIVAPVVLLTVLVTRKRRRRGSELARIAEQLGVSYTSYDPFGLHRLDFELFTLGVVRHCQNVLAGTRQGREVRVADFSYSEVRGGEGLAWKFSVVLVSIPAWLPHVIIGQKGWPWPVTESIRFESDQFNQRFRVRTDDRKFAYDLVDARMMAWLLSTPGWFGCEVNGEWVLLYRPRLPPEELPLLLDTGMEFVERIPRAISARFRKRAAW